MNPREKRQGYALAVIVSLAVLMVRYALSHPLGEQPLLLPFVLAVIVAAWRGGLGPGILATGFATLLGVLFLIPPLLSLSITEIEYILDTIVFVAIGLTVSFLCEALHAARRREIDNQFRMLADSMPQLAWMAQPDGYRFWFNQQWYMYTGAASGELEGNGWQRRLDPAEAAEILRRWRFSIETGVVWEDTFQVRGRDSQNRWFLCRAVPIRDERGDITCWLGTSTDISERKEYELAIHQLNKTLESRVAERTSELQNQTDQLSQSKQELFAKSSMLQSILDAAPDAIVTINRTGDIKAANRASERLFGYAEKELCGQNVSILMPPPFRDEHDQYIRRFLQTREPHIIGIGREGLAQRKDGSAFPVDLTVSEVEHLGLFTGIVRDITERKELQREVLEIAAAEDRRIGHELHDNTQQQLTGLGLLAQSLAENLACKSAPEAQIAARVARGIKEAAAHVHLLSRGLVPVDVDGEGLRAALTDLSKRVSDQYAVACCFHCEGRVDLLNNFAATHLFRIAQEAINNAVKHGHAKKIEISLTGTNETVILAVLDNGVGISANGDRPSGAGLRIMRHRADLIGAILRIHPAQTGGTVVQCQVTRHEGTKEDLRERKTTGKSADC